ncbi:MAG: serine hydrolase [Alphaproteobacteria bacterium]|nr:serine hydrolase [Alphaproteobacteria bacterium]
MKQALEFFTVILAVCLLVPILAQADETMLEGKIKQAYADGKLKGLHSVLVLHKGKMIAEVYFPGMDQRWGVDLGIVPHNADSIHDLRSVTKSITGLLYGIALSEGLVPGLDEPLVAQFPEYPDLMKDPERQKILVRHALTMTMGVQWDESLPYTSTRNSEIAMTFSADPIEYALSQPMDHKPGSHWTYSGGATALIGALIQKGVGMPLDVYAKQKLFEPLGIENFEWVKDLKGQPAAASGLRLTAHDLAKIGTMMMHKGAWEGHQVVPRAWVEESVSPAATVPDGLRYGFFWWLADEGNPPYWFAGFGNGGQRLTVNANRDMVVVIYAGNYNKPDAWKVPAAVILDYVIPATASQ